MNYGIIPGVNMWQYSQQVLSDSGRGGGKASRRKLRKRRKQPSLFLSLLVFFLPAASSLCCSFCAFLRCQGRDGDNARQHEDKEISHLVLNTTIGSPLSSTFLFPLPPLHLRLHYTSTSKQRILVGQERDVSTLSFSSCPLLLSFTHLSLNLLGQQDEWRVRG